jgi:hypothetical protein
MGVNVMPRPVYFRGWPGNHYVGHLVGLWTELSLIHYTGSFTRSTQRASLRGGQNWCSILHARLVNGHRRFELTFCLHLHGSFVDMYQRSGGTYCLRIQLFPENGDSRYLRNMAAFYQTTRCHISEFFSRLDGAVVNINVMNTRLAFHVGGRLQAILLAIHSDRWNENFRYFTFQAEGNIKLLFKATRFRYLS